MKRNGVAMKLKRTKRNYFSTLNLLADQKAFWKSTKFATKKETRSVSSKIVMRTLSQKVAILNNFFTQYFQSLMR